ncbi:MAG: amidohydrolase family protein, partial [Bacteroidia bacterium]|nr:amidohydrolase family protein [Bacteroidia bacterium]
IAEPGNIIKNATVLIQEKKIIDAGTSVTIPKNAIVRNLNGLYLYPGLIDFYSSYGIAIEKDAKKNIKPASGNWNDAIKPEYQAANNFKINTKEAEDYRNLGFGAVLTHQKDGIMRGTSVLVGLGDKNENYQLIKKEVTQHLSFDKGSSRQNYPTSLMGVIALIRQTYLDAAWYPNQDKEYNESLAAINEKKKLPSVFEVTSVFSALRADRIGDETGINYIIKSNGDDYKRLEEIKKTNCSLVLPVNFPKPPEINDVTQLREINFADLKHWELAPFNPTFIYQQKIPFVLTASDLKDKSIFFANLRKAIKNGLPENEALQALTTTPAKWMGEQNNLGAVKKNYLANFIICSKPLFDEDNTILENWILGERYEINTLPDTALPGVYKITIGNEIFETELKGNTTLKGVIKKDSAKYDVAIVIKNQTADVTFNFPDKNLYYGTLLITAKNPILLKGNVTKTSKESVLFTAEYLKPLSVKKQEIKKQDSVIIPKIYYPFTAYGYTELPKPKAVLIKNAMVWTNTNEGVKLLDILIKDGKIEQVGNALTATNNAEIIDAKGKHVTNGIIDEHSHIAITGGVNEGSQENTAEVRIGDVLNAEDINIYRQLAGGVTTSQLLHGSANPIGGQAAIVKLRWGKNQEQLKLEGVDNFIKFALGENVKQSNWGGGNRYPKTRMGVEQVYIDAFYKAQEYQNNLKTNPKQTRRNLELDALCEILNKKRFITCHSYIQSEINMLMHVADSFHFKVNTFTHVLEGYKVADKLYKHGASAGTFADWWAYKFEVNDAIPYNAAILHNTGICTAINSDDPEMGRRLNQEAAKIVKYGGISEEDAWKMVTLNPAKILHLDKRLGSIEKGKDADLVIWSDNPLSIYSVVEKTFIDGICYYDKEVSKQLLGNSQKEKLRLFSKINEAKKNGEKTEPFKPKPQETYHCDTENSLEHF